MKFDSYGYNRCWPVHEISDSGFRLGNFLLIECFIFKKRCFGPNFSTLGTTERKRLQKIELILTIRLAGFILSDTGFEECPQEGINMISTTVKTRSSVRLRE